MSELDKDVIRECAVKHNLTDADLMFIDARVKRLGNQKHNCLGKNIDWRERKHNWVFVRITKSKHTTSYFFYKYRCRDCNKTTIFWYRLRL